MISSTTPDSEQPISMPPREGRFYVEYLGWKETRGLYGLEFTTPVVNKLISSQRFSKNIHRMTVKVTRDNIQITQIRTHSNGRVEKVKYPRVQICDVSFVAQSKPPNADVVSCIFLGYNYYTHCASHVHAYRFDSPSTAAAFVRLINSLTGQAEYRERILAMEKDLTEIDQGHVNSQQSAPLTLEKDSFGSDGTSNSCHSPNSSDSGYGRSYPTAEDALKQRKDIVIKKSAHTHSTAKPALSLQAELEYKLSMQNREDAPILLPPKDYDTIVRRHGHLSIRAKVKQRSIIGSDAVFQKPPATATSDTNNNTGKNRLSNLSQTSSSTESPPDSDSNSGSLDESINVYGLYKGLKDDGDTSHDDMVMWSPDYSFDHHSAGETTDRRLQLSESNGGALRRMRF